MARSVLCIYLTSVAVTLAGVVWLFCAVGSIKISGQGDLRPLNLPVIMLGLAGILAARVARWLIKVGLLEVACVAAMAAVTAVAISIW